MLVPLLTFVLLCNPISIFIIVSAIIVLYVFVLFCCMIYSTFTATRDFIITEWHPYMDPETIQQLEQLRLHFKVRSWTKQIIGQRGTTGDYPTMEISQPPTFIKKNPWIAKLFLIGPLLSYMLTRLVVHTILSGFQFLLVKAYYTIPSLIRLVHTMYKGLAIQVFWLRSLFMALVYPIWNVIYPVIEYMVMFSLRMTLKSLEWFLTYMPKMVVYLEQSTRQFRLAVYHSSKEYIDKIVLFCKYVWEEHIIHFMEQTRQIAIKLWPKVQKAILTVVAVCEALDNRFRPIFKQYLGWLMKNINWFILVGWTIFHLVSHSLMSIILLPYTLTQALTTVLYQQMRPLLNFLSDQAVHRLLPIFWQGIEIIQQYTRHGVEWITFWTFYYLHHPRLKAFLNSMRAWIKESWLQTRLWVQHFMEQAINSITSVKRTRIRLFLNIMTLI